MAVLNLRGVPDQLASQLKADAALMGRTLRDHCVQLLSGRGVEGHASAVAVAGSTPAVPLGRSSEVEHHRDSRSGKPKGLGMPKAEQVSSPAAPTNNQAEIAQLAEQRSSSPQVSGSSPALRSNFSDYSGIVHDPEFCQDRNCRECRKLRSAN